MTKVPYCSSSLAGLWDLISDDIVETQPSELLAEAVEDGEDPHVLAQEFLDIASAAIARTTLKTKPVLKRCDN